MNCSQTYTCSEPYLLPSSKFQTPLCSLNFSRASAAQVAAKQVTILIADWSSCCPKGLQAKPHTHRNSWIAFLMVKMTGGIARGRVRTTTMTMTMTSRNMAAILQLISGPRHAALIYRVHLWYWTWAGGVARIFQRGSHIVSKWEYSPDCHVDPHGFRHLLWDVCSKKPYKSGEEVCHEGPRTPLVMPLLTPVKAR